mmetsp:Transcript_12139/g.31168  ORF Transcript_12139/g.31168 Transcript_12139/m.31168 type:complete len:666 (-) Transcript_12139:14-2011(-)
MHGLSPQRRRGPHGDMESPAASERTLSRAGYSPLGSLVHHKLDDVEHHELRRGAFAARRGVALLATLLLAVGVVVTCSMRPRLTETALRSAGASLLALAEEEAGLNATGRCSQRGENCWTSMCCEDPSTTCYAKDLGWAECLNSCTPGMHWDDAKEWKTPWNCARVARGALGVAAQADASPERKCVARGKNCAASRCCTDPLSACYEEYAGSAICARSCSPARDHMTCTLLRSEDYDLDGRFAKKGAQCAVQKENCVKSRCCQAPGAKCYKKHEFWAQCRASCTRGVDMDEAEELRTPWSCEVLEEPQSQALAQLAKLAAKMSRLASKPLAAKPVMGQCSAAGQNCRTSRCCADSSMQCYEKDSERAECRKTCVPSIRAEDAGELRTAPGWSCKLLTPVFASPEEPPSARKGARPAVAPTSELPGTQAAAGDPTLYCFSLMQPQGYEVSLIAVQLLEQASIFRCDGYDIFSNREIELSPGPPARVSTTVVEGSLHCEIGGVWNTALDTPIFVRIWKKVTAMERYLQFDWTVKVDPDAVMFADRLRQKLEPRTRRPSEAAMLTNCNKFSLKLFGSVEVFSEAAMQVYFTPANFDDCTKYLGGWQTWGEDKWMESCMSRHGVQEILDEGIVGDARCWGSNCGDYQKAAFHPFKDIGSWFQCYNTATR